MKLLTLKQVKEITQIPESTLRNWAKSVSYTHLTLPTMS